MEPERYVRALRDNSRLLKAPRANSTCLVLDTDIVIYLLRRNPRQGAVFEPPGTVRGLPVVPDRRRGGLCRRVKIEGFFGLCERLSLDMETARLAGQYAYRHRNAYQGVSLEDYLLAATAKKNRCPLWTGNRKHYPTEDILLF